MGTRHTDTRFTLCQSACRVNSDKGEYDEVSGLDESSGTAFSFVGHVEVGLAVPANCEHLIMIVESVKAVDLVDRKSVV